MFYLFLMIFTVQYWDDLDRESKQRESNMEQLEKCRIKYQELTKNKLTKP